MRMPCVSWLVVLPLVACGAKDVPSVAPANPSEPDAAPRPDAIAPAPELASVSTPAPPPPPPVEPTPCRKMCGEICARAMLAHCANPATDELCVTACAGHFGLCGTTKACLDAAPAILACEREATFVCRGDFPVAPACARQVQKLKACAQSLLTK